MLLPSGHIIETIHKYHIIDDDLVPLQSYDFKRDNKCIYIEINELSR